MPTLYIIAGPNGAGKTTLAGELLKEIGVIEFVNADNIAKGISPFNTKAVEFLAGRLMLERINQLISLNENFAIETTLSSRTYVSLCKQLIKKKYKIYLFFISLSDYQLAQKRVRERVKRGGHNIPEEVVKRRFNRGLENLNKHFLQLADHCLIIDNSENTPIKICVSENGVVRKIFEADICKRIIHQS
jgi:predicted ABC-type ATPase